jgi:hypothetical protein
VERVPRFGRYVAVDWSARSVPASGADSIWIAVVDAGVDGTPELHNPRTRCEAAAILAASVLDHAPTLVGVDVGLGYPAGTVRRFGLERPGEPAWRSMWRWLAAAVSDDARNANNRFEVAAELNRRGGEAAGPFWGCPATRTIDSLGPRKPAPGELPAFRATELALRAAGRSPMSMWQLAGAGSVGGQSFTAIPVLQRWCDALGRRALVWPFDSGVVEPAVGPGAVVIAEVWPTQFDPTYPAGTVRDAAQVAHVATRLRAADRTGELARWFEPAVAGPAADAADAVVREEGWVLGP